jgi:hypothetical protein
MLAKRKTLAEQRAAVQEMEVGLGILESQLLELQLQVEAERRQVAYHKLQLVEAERRGLQSFNSSTFLEACYPREESSKYLLLKWVGKWISYGPEHGRGCLFESPARAMEWASLWDQEGFRPEHWTIVRVSEPAPVLETEKK